MIYINTVNGVPRYAIDEATASSLLLKRRAILDSLLTSKDMISPHNIIELETSILGAQLATIVSTADILSDTVPWVLINVETPTGTVRYSSGYVEGKVVYGRLYED